MTYAFLATDASVEEAVRRVAREEVEGALAALRRDGPLGPRVHEMRKSVKKLRGLLRLVRPVVRAARSENAALRDAGAGLSSLRDAAVLLATAEGLAAGLEEGRREALLGPLREAAAAHDAAAAEAFLPAFEAAMEGVLERSQGWRVKAEGWDAVEPGLEDTWTQARAAMKAALKARDPDEDPELAHEWRKRVKDHWYQARLLQPIWPDLMTPHVKAADDLGELLGKVNDLSVLLHRLEADDMDPEVAGEAARLARERRAALLAEAEPLSRRLLAGPADALGRRWGAWWGLRLAPQA